MAKYVRYNAIVGAVLRGYRGELNITQEQLARQVRLSSSTVARIERGEIPITVAQLHKFAHILDTLPGNILTLADELWRIG
jgi:transcriptional regulator with XRE-family HTH domain